MEASVAAPAFHSKGLKMESPCSSPSFSRSSDKRFWSNLKSRVDMLLEKRSELDHQSSGGEVEEEVGKKKRLSEDTAMLLRGFDSVAHTLCQLSSNIDNALQGAKDLAKPPTMTDMLQVSLKSIDTKQSLNEDDSKDKEEDSDRGRKRKLAADDPREEDARNVEEDSPDDKMLKKAKNLAVSMATKASFLAKELKSIKSDLCFMQERCVILEEENEMLRHGYNKGIQPEEDDLVRLQLEALLAEKSRLANENANLTRENQCLRQLVEYHQATSQDLSATYEEVINGICLDFSSPPSSELDGAQDKIERRLDSNQQEANEHQFKGFLKFSS